MSYSCSETWGKYDRENQRWLSLKLHCLDVSAVFRALCDIPTLHRSLDRASGSQLVDGQLDRLAVIAGIHDIGKANHGFQEKILPGSKIKAGHVREVAALFFEPDLSKKIWSALDFETLSEWFEGGITDLSSFLIAAFSHHGRPLVFDPHEKNKQYRPDWWYPAKGRDPLQTIQKLGEALRKAYPVAFKADVSKIPSLPSLQHLFAGLVMLADWLGSHQGFFPINRPSDSSFNYSKETQSSSSAFIPRDVLTS